MGAKDHFWIGQQVINDVQDDGKITLAGRSYEVDEQIRRAIIDHPDRFRMGNLGPDVFPDPVVGQTTTHPGLKKGWKTDEWLKHLITSANSPDEVAMAFGFVAHAAGDVFAHTYVNAYAGDVFILTDDERDVERRHFVLEKYIEALTPCPTDNSGSVANSQQDSERRLTICVTLSSWGKKSHGKTPWKEVACILMQCLRSAGC